MRMELHDSYCKLVREPGDKRMPTENAVTHAMKQALLASEVKAHRVRGNVGLTSCTQVLRLPKSKSTLWHERYAIEQAHQAYNNGSVIYQRVWDEPLRSGNNVTPTLPAQR